MDKSKRMLDVLVKYERSLEFQRNGFVALRIVVLLLLCLVLAGVYLLFSVWTEKGIALGFCQEQFVFRPDVNGTRLLWIIVFLDVVLLVWVTVRTILQLKRYHICISKLKALLYVVAVQNGESDEKLDVDEVCEEMQNLMSVFEKKNATHP